MTNNGSLTGNNFWLDRHVLITGANGFLGSHLTRRLIKAGAQVSVFLRPNTQRLYISDVISKAQVIEGDITDADSVRKAVTYAQPDFVYHLAAAGVMPGLADETIGTVNMLGTLYLLKASSLGGVSRFVYVGSCFEYGAGSDMSENHVLNPMSVYAASKVAGHALTQSFGHSSNLPVVSIRPFTPYGPSERTSRLIPYAIVSALKGEAIRITQGEQERDYIYVDDVIEGFLMAGECPDAVGRTFNLCSGQAVRIKDVVSCVLGLLENPVRVFFGALPYRADEIFEHSGNNTLAKTVLGWEPQVSLRDGLQRTIRWYRENL